MGSFDFNYLEKSCVMLCTESVGEGCGIGTGNVIFNDGFHKLILTCGHNVAVYFEANKVVKFSVRIGGSSWQPATLVTTEKYAREELALLKTGFYDVGEVCVVDLSAPKISKGMDLYMSSYMSTASTPSNTTGTLSQPHIPGHQVGLLIDEVVGYNILTALGSSGAAVVDSLGKLVAIHINADMVKICYNPQYDFAKFNLTTPCAMRYGVPHYKVRDMIDDVSRSLVSKVSNTFEERLYYLATTMVPKPLNRSPKVNKQQESSVETKLCKEHMEISQLWYQRLHFHRKLYELREERIMKPETFASLVSATLYEKRFGPYLCQPVIAGLGDGNKPFICTMDSIGAKELAKDFVIAGTASESLYGACESIYKAEMEPEELFETISQALQASVDRDCLSGWGAHVYLVFGPYFCQPVIVGLGDGNKPFICTMDPIGAKELAKDFVVAGTASESLYGACESMYKPKMYCVGMSNT